MKIYPGSLAAMTTVLCLAAYPLAAQTYSKQFITSQQISNATSNFEHPPVAVGDLNGDGRPDILYATTALLQNSNGTFRVVTTGQTVSNAAKLADINGDGKLDIVDTIPADEECDYNPDGTPYCNINSDAFVKVYLGNGDGTFRAGQVIDLGQEGSGVATLSVLDLNNDKKPDASVNFSGNPEDSASNTAFVLLNNGGTLKSNGTSLPPILASGDFNGDGKTDLVVSGSVLFGVGNGTFTQGPQLPNMGGTSAAVGDFDHDGHLDIAATGYGNGTSGVVVTFGNGKGQFTTPKSISTLYGETIVAADVNHDGYLDLLAGYASVAVYTNLHNRTFSAPKVYAGQVPLGGVPATTFFAADFNHDGYVDFLQQNLITFGQKGGGFSAPIETMSAFAGSVAVGDFNKDGIDDVAITNNSVGTVTVFPGSGQGYLNAGVKYSTGIAAATVAVGDVNGDGIADLVVARSSEQNLYGAPPKGSKDLSVLLGNSNGTFRTAISSATLGSIANYTFNMQTYLVDVNHDGKLDLIGDWGVALGNGDGTFKAPIPFPSPVTQISGIGVGDFNRDGNVDVAVSEFGYTPNSTQPATPTIYTLLGNGTGHFTISHQETLASGTLINALTAADLDGDGNPDLIYVSQPAGTSTQPSNVSVELGEGNGSFRQANVTSVNSLSGSYASLLVGDFNQDGHKDVVVLTLNVYGPPNDDSVYLPGNGAGGFEAAQYFPVQSYTGAVMELNSDDAPDIIATGVDQLGVQRVLNTGAKN